MESGTQPWYPLVEEASTPTFAPIDALANFDTEADAINFSVDQVVRNTRGLTHMALADDMRMAKSVLTRLRQGQIGMPINRLLEFIRATQSYALLQFYAMNLGLVVKRKEDEQADQQQIQRLQKRVSELQDQAERYRKAAGQ